MSYAVTAKQIDALLPQTQCGLCGYAGCMPYAQALARQETTIDLCPPGGVKVLKDLAELLQQDAQPFIPAMEKKAKPKLMAKIREDECIGCTKCIQACPVDAILGAAKQMHSIITDECTGCELCVAPCPVDCIDIFAIKPASASEDQQKADQARQRFQNREKRLQEDKIKEKLLHPTVNLSQQSQTEKTKFIAEALLRVKSKKT